ncbi:MAG: cytochrome c oxidase assembly protein [Streptosporangiaceae bacterium]
MLPPYGLSAVVTQWQFAPVVTGLVAVLAGLYGWGVVRVARRHPARPWPPWRTALFGAGLLVIVVATQSGIGAYDDVLFYDHMIQHLLLLMVAPALLIASQPLTLLLHASRNPLHTWAKRVVRSPVASFLTWPVFGTICYGLAVLAAHLTALATYVAQNQAAHDAEHALFLLIGYLFLLPILGTEPIRWRLSYPVRFVLLVLLMPIDTFTGVALGYGSATSPGVPTGPRPAWAPSPVSDLHTGGAVMWVGGDAIMFGLMMIVFLMWARDERVAVSGRSFFERARRENLASLLASAERAPAGPAAAGGGDADPGLLAGSRGSIDDDEHLAAYNEYLARLNRQHDPAG